MRRLALALMLLLAGCEIFDFTQTSGTGSGDMQGWRFASGKTPSRAEYSAMVAACQDGAVRFSLASSTSGTLDACLADLGMKRAP